MKILVVGGDGMLGHQVFKHLQKRHEVRVTLRKNISVYSNLEIFNPENAYFEIDVRLFDVLVDVFADFQPQAVVNGIGIVKQRSTAKESISSLEINSLFPHRLALLCKASGARMIHMSTDCVFSGNKGNYRETDPSDAEDLYGKSKYLGEVHSKNCLTVRTSFIGKELSRKTSLLEWFLAQWGSVKGFKNAIFSGFTTLEISRIIEMLLVDYPAANGLYHVSSDPINKYDLLTLIKKKMLLSIDVIPDEYFKCDRSLDSTRFRNEFKFDPPGWEEMIGELCKDLSAADPLQ